MADPNTSPLNQNLESNLLMTYKSLMIFSNEYESDRMGVKGTQTHSSRLPSSTIALSTSLIYIDFSYIFFQITLLTINSNITFNM